MGIRIVESFARAQELRNAHMGEGGRGTNRGTLVLDVALHDAGMTLALIEKVIFAQPWAVVAHLPVSAINWKKKVEIFVVGYDSMEVLRRLDLICPGFIEHHGPVVEEAICHVAD